MGITSLPIMFWLVPMRPTLAPAACSKIALSRYVVVVFPLVPVTATMVISSAGWPK